MPSRQQLKQLQLALINAFPSKSSLEQLLYFELEKNLNEITKDSNLQDIVFNLIQTAETQGWLVDLVRAARKENPGNSQLEVIAGELLSPKVPSVPIHTAPSEQSQQRQRILILAANPIGTSQLCLDEELREIEQGLGRAKQRDKFDIKSALVVRSRDIQRSILDFKPHIVHFSGHGTGQDGLVLENETGHAKLVDALALARLFKLFANRVNCVVLNACYLEIQARGIAQHINYVIGMSQAVGDRAAIEFAVGFYDALGAGESIEFAYELGCTLIQILGISEELTPKLLEKQLNLELLTPASDSGLNPPPNEVIESRSTTNERNDLDDDDLSSAANVDYTKLRNFLKAGQWKEADYETYLVMLSVVGRKDGDWIRPKELSNFKSTDLRTIDSLWVKYSNGRFGFSVQKKIYLDVGGKPDGRYDEGAWKNFGEAIGWSVNGSWIGYDDVTFNTIAPQGHLPIYRYTRIYRYTLVLNKTNEINNKRWGLGAGAVGGVAGLFSRIQACKL